MKHTHLIGVVIALFWFASCNNPTPANSVSSGNDSTTNKTMDKTDMNRRVAMECMDAFNTHDTGKLSKNLAANFIEYQDGSMPPQKADSAMKGLQMFLNSFPDMKGENAIYCADGNNVMVAADWSMTFTNDMNGMKATGKTCKYKDVDIYTFDDHNKITSHRSIYPLSAMMMQVGIDMAKMQMMMDKDKMNGDKKK